MSITLYQAEALAALHNFVDDETGEVNIDAFEQAQFTLAEKQRGCVAYYLNNQATIESMKAHIKLVSDKIAAVEHQQTRMKSYIIDSMKRTGTSEIKAIDGTFSAKLYIDRDESVEIDIGAEFPAELCNPPKQPPPLTPSKKLIKEAIENGEPIKGARIVKNDRLTITWIKQAA